MVQRIKLWDRPTVGGWKIYTGRARNFRAPNPKICPRIPQPKRDALASFHRSRYPALMDDDDADVLKITVELTPTHVLVRSSDKGHDLQDILRQLQDAVSLVQFQLAEQRQLH